MVKCVWFVKSEVTFHFQFNDSLEAEKYSPWAVAQAHIKVHFTGTHTSGLNRGSIKAMWLMAPASFLSGFFWALKFWVVLWTVRIPKYYLNHQLSFDHKVLENPPPAAAAVTILQGTLALAFGQWYSFTSCTHVFPECFLLEPGLIKL